MTDATPAARPCAEEAAWRLEDIAGELTVADLHARLHHTRHSTYLTATTHAHHQWGEVEATIDDDNYIELRFWASPDAAPARIAAAVTAAMTAIASARQPGP